PPGFAELSGAGTGFAELGDVFALWIEARDFMAAEIGDREISATGDRQSDGGQFSWSSRARFVELAEVLAIGAELLDATFCASVANPDVPVRVGDDRRRFGELAVAGSKAAALGEVCAAGAELLDAGVFTLGDPNVARGIHSDGVGESKFAIPRTFFAELS